MTKEQNKFVTGEAQVRAALKMAIEALYSCDSAEGMSGKYQFYNEKLIDPAINACKEALDTEQVREGVVPAQDDDLMEGRWVRFNEDDDTTRLLMELENAMNGVEGSAQLPAVIDVLRQAVDYFKQPAQEPVAWMAKSGSFTAIAETKKQLPKGIEQPTPLYTRPTKPLSDDEIDIFINPMPQNIQNDDLRKFARAIERAHGIGE